ncbi:MAG: phosphoribosyl-AMP cyclohydrolase [Clostridiales bacterium]|jgi:phosphoribosyl-ATP pyrophosphohydrolase/phosphoribosyl-AMP cyclohydrolase|nr:phosphoribosyl-AMP cyclohydrolase [Clostridiales bacterium]
MDGDFTNGDFMDGCFYSGETAGLLVFDGDGLIPAVVQDFYTREVLTVAYMNREALEISVRERRTCFWSRSRGQLWRKGETSGNTQRIARIVADCDYDALVVQVIKRGPACHKNVESCFHNELFSAAGGAESGASAESGANCNGNAAAGGSTTRGSAACGGGATGAAGNRNGAGNGSGGAACAGEAPFSLDALYATLLRRKLEMPEKSYTTYLFEKGLEKILKKVGEESAEVIIGAMKRSRDEVIYEAADLTYHMLVLLCELGIRPGDVLRELAGRSGGSESGAAAPKEQSYKQLRRRTESVGPADNGATASDGGNRAGSAGAAARPGGDADSQIASDASDASTAVPVAPILPVAPIAPAGNGDDGIAGNGGNGEGGAGA